MVRLRLAALAEAVSIRRASRVARIFFMVYKELEFLGFDGDGGSLAGGFADVGHGVSPVGFLNRAEQFRGHGVGHVDIGDDLLAVVGEFLLKEVDVDKVLVALIIIGKIVVVEGDVGEGEARADVGGQLHSGVLDEVLEEHIGVAILSGTVPLYLIGGEMEGVAVALGGVEDDIHVGAGLHDDVDELFEALIVAVGIGGEHVVVEKLLVLPNHVEVNILCGHGVVDGHGVGVVGGAVHRADHTQRHGALLVELVDHVSEFCWAAGGDHCARQCEEKDSGNILFHGLLGLFGEY
mgnify:CR=1 FL=1